jgi:hypothetical protein
MTIPRAGGRGSDGRRLAALAALLAGSLALYGALAVLLGSPPPGWDGMVGFSVPSALMFRAFTGLPAVALSRVGWSVAVALDLALLWALLGAAILIQRRFADAATRRRARLLVMGGSAVLLLVVVVFLPPLLSSDLYRQAIHARMVRRGLNPYAVTAAASGDPLLPFASLTGATSIYGPAYTWISTLTSLLFPDSALGVVLGWKTMSALAAFGCIALAAPVARSLDAEATEAETDEARLWLAWNPLLLLEAAGMAHVESVMMLPALAGILLLQRGRPAGGVALLALSTLTKWVTGVLLVLSILREIRRAPPSRRLPVALGLAGVVAIVGGVLYAWFVPGLFSSAGGIHALALRGAGGFGSASAAGPPQWARMAGFAAAVALAAPFATGRDGAHLVASATALMLLFVLVVVPWLFPWYLVAPIALAVVLPPGGAGRWLRFTSLGFAAGLMLYYANLVPPG